MREETLEIGGQWHRRRLAEHLAAIEVAVGRAQLAIELGHGRRLESALSSIRSESHLANVALAKALHAEEWARGPSSRERHFVPGGVRR